ncbi:MAG TPA: hypothetical protein VJC18_09825 [bacterium]|nr:hypothetical protein [bacterium]
MSRFYFALCFCFFCLFTTNIQANEETHALGNTGYMIREAMHEQANRKDSTDYFGAIKMQNEAKAYMHGTHKLGRHKQKYRELAQSAYELAKQARDSSIAEKANCTVQNARCKMKESAVVSKGSLKYRRDVNQFSTPFGKKNSSASGR